MKPAIFLLTVLFISNAVKGESRPGNMLNIGVGNSWYGPYRVPVRMLHLNYEFPVANKFTLAPYIGWYFNNSTTYLNHPKYGYRTYRYYETLVPIGIKGNYYLDNDINLDKKWDLYAGASLGFALIRTHDAVIYDRNRTIYRNVYGGSTPLFLDVHLGTRYHINEKFGIYLDLSTAISSIGLSIKTK